MKLFRVLLILVAGVFLWGLFTPPDHRWQRIMADSDLHPVVLVEPGTRRLVFRVPLPDTLEDFDPDVPWFVMVDDCSLLTCNKASGLSWRVDTSGRSPTHHHWFSSPHHVPDLVVRYGEAPAGWTTTVPLRPLLVDRCYYVMIRVDNRAGKAAFVVGGDSVRYRVSGRRPGTAAECWALANGDRPGLR